MKFTTAQQKAIQARGNTVVIAGAGTGKTRTLVERCVRLLLDVEFGVSLEEILMVTFTDAAAAEMRQRIRARLEEELTRQPDTPRLSEQLALLETAHISTLHSFCLQLVREHFYELELDPQITVLDEQQSRLLGREILDELLQAHYAGSGPEDAAVQRLIREEAPGWDVPIRELVLRLHEYTQTRPDPEGWFHRELTKFEQPDPGPWRPWLLEGANWWREISLPLLRAQDPANVNAGRCARILDGFSAAPTRERAAAALTEILRTDETWPPNQKGQFRTPLEGFYSDAAFLHSLLVSSGRDPLVEDWDWVRSQMATLLRLARGFARRFSAAKRESAAVDFHDLEQHALRLLWDAPSDRPTPLAEEWRRKLKLVFVDEYQDINAAQDRILAALSREGAEGNRFLVGDVKQSIYRFRGAAPRIFQNYAEEWRHAAAGGQAIFLADNFRSPESLLNFVNRFFAGLMRSEIGGVEYDDDARLRCGDRIGQGEPGEASDPGPRVEVHLRLKEKDDLNGEAPEPDSLAELSDAEREARLIGLRLLELHSNKHHVLDQEVKQGRPVRWGDMVVLLRSPKFKVEAYVKEFAQLGIPLQARRSDFFESVEVLDLLNALTVLDNPLQDLPLLAVLRSPLVGLSLDELARVRSIARKVPFWTALLRYAEMGKVDFKSVETKPAPGVEAATFRKVSAFLERYSRWRSLARHASLAQRLETILAETYYLDWLLTQPRGEQRQANVRQLITVARRFGELHGRGLYRFLNFIESQREAAGDHEPAPLETGDAVRLMSIHQCKGLEFPVVVVADLGKRFNLSEARSGIILDEVYGLCPQVKPPDAGQSFPSLPYWLAKRRKQAEALGEELRILYVALTRAQDFLILTGTCAAKTARESWPDCSGGEVADLLKANSYLDWLGPWLTRTADTPDWIEQVSGESDLWRWRIHAGQSELPPDILTPGATESDLTSTVVSQPATHEPAASGAGVPPAVGASRPRIPRGRDARADSRDGCPTTAEPPFIGPLRAQNGIEARLQWRYPYEGATRQPAKSSVTALRRKLADEADAEAQPAPFAASKTPATVARRDGKLAAAEIGIAHHRFLQRVSLAKVGSAEGLRREAERLRLAEWLSQAELAALNFEALDGFWQSDLGRELRANAPSAHRELPFTARFSAADLIAAGLPGDSPLADKEFVVVQGVIDLAVVLPSEVWLVDFKTDQVAEQELQQKVKFYIPQLKLYAFALGRIYHRPVTHCWVHFLQIRRTVSV